MSLSDEARHNAADLLADLIDAASPADTPLTSTVDALIVVDAIAHYTRTLALAHPTPHEAIRILKTMAQSIGRIQPDNNAETAPTTQHLKP